MKYLDYTPPKQPSAVIGGKLVPLSLDALQKLAMNAMLLANSQVKK